MGGWLGRAEPVSAMMRDDRRQSNASVQSPFVTPDLCWFI